MISVQLATGDYSVGADGTVTCLDGDRLYAFGHRFLGLGDTDLPFSRSEVLTLLPSLQSSFKISAPREPLGSITQDRSVAVTGRLGRAARMVPVTIRLRLVNDRFLAPFLLQMAVFSAIDATERVSGTSTLTVRGQLNFEGGLPPVRVENIFSGDYGTPQLAALALASPLSYALNSGFDAVRLRSAEVDIDSSMARRQLQIDQLYASRSVVRPGETIEITTVLAGENGQERVTRTPYQVPVGALTGTLNITAADALFTNFLEFRQLVSTPPRTPAAVLAFLNDLRPNTAAYLRLWRADAVYQLHGRDLPDPPASFSAILGRSQAGLGGATLSRNAKLAEFPIPAGDYLVSGSKTIQVEVKE
jgi:hypothetical protein